MGNDPQPAAQVAGTVLVPGVVLAGPNVKVDQIVPELAKVVVYLGRIHLALFDTALVLTSGNDGTHAAGSKHSTNQAVDIRSRDLSPDAELAFAAVLAWASPAMGFGVFDERHLASGPHWHIEV